MNLNTVYRKRAAITVIASVILFASCQKEQMVTENTLDSPAGVMAKAANGNAKTSAEDKAFDKAVQQIMADMMKAMNKMEMTCDPDIDFARMMIMHHEAGIEMSEAELQLGHEARAKELAQESIEGDEASIERLEAFLASHPTPEPLSKEQCKQFMKEMDEAMKAMMMCMQKAPDTEDVDVDYANLMICHHRAALAMSSIELKWGNDAAARQEAQNIIDEQTTAIMEFQEFINQHSGGMVH